MEQGRWDTVLPRDMWDKAWEGTDSEAWVELARRAPGEHDTPPSIPDAATILLAPT